MQEEPKVEWHVCYKANPEYKGSFNVPKKPGCHGKFGEDKGGMEGAKAGAEACKKWFNEESHLTMQVVGGQKVEQIKTTVHDNVIVWIEKYIDGVLAGEETKCESESLKGKKKKEEPALA